MPLDEDGHGTHVTGTIAERDGQPRRPDRPRPEGEDHPVRVLDSEGFGTARNIARGIRYAATHKAQVINMSFEFSLGVNSCAKIKGICSAIKFAFKRGALVVAAAGNENGEPVAFPAGAPHVDRRRAHDQGRLPGERLPHRRRPRPGGARRRLPAAQHLRERRLRSSPAGCRSSSSPSTAPASPTSATRAATRGPRWPPRTSPGVAAMVIASRVVGSSPTAVECQLEATARHTDSQLGQPYDPRLFGAGLIDAAAAVRARAPGLLAATPQRRFSSKSSSPRRFSRPW